MINIRSLFDSRRFADCENPRQLIGDFEIACHSYLSLFCEETEDGGVQLLIDERGRLFLRMSILCLIIYGSVYCVGMPGQAML